MRYHKFSPDPQLSSLVEQIIFIASTEEILYHPGMCVPFSNPALVINIGLPFWIKNQGLTQLPKIFFVGPMQSGQTLVPDTSFDTIIILFKPTGLYHLFGISMQELCKFQHFDASRIFNNPTEDLYNRLLKTCMPEKRNKIIESFLIDLSTYRKLRFDVVEEFIDIIVDHAGTISIKDLIEDSAISDRTFRDMFLKKVGLSAKTFARIIRFNEIFDQLSSGTAPCWQDLVYSFGYHDQAHFIKDFKTFTGLSPAMFYSLDLPYIRKISAK